MLAAANAAAKRKALAQWSQGRRIGMSTSYGLALKDATVANSDGEGMSPRG
jgi:hypothetical protein